MPTDVFSDPRRSTPPGAVEEPRAESAARTALKLLLAGQQPAEDGAYGDFFPIIMLLAHLLASDGPVAVRRQYALLREHNPNLARLMDGKTAYAGELSAPEDAPGEAPAYTRASTGVDWNKDRRPERRSGEAQAAQPSGAPLFAGLCPPLPESAQIAPEVGADACAWLDDYLAYSHRWSPLAYDDFHEAVAIWLLSTVAAHRVLVPFGGQQYTPLFIALVARTSLYAKSTTARIAKRTLRAAGLDWLLLPDESTPQKMIQEMAGNRLTEDYENLPDEMRERLRLGLAMAGQRGWFYD